MAQSILWARLVVSQTLHMCKPTGKLVKSLALIGEILTPADLRQESSQGTYITLMIWMQMVLQPQFERCWGPALKKVRHKSQAHESKSGGGWSQAGRMVQFTRTIRMGFGESGHERLGNKSLGV